MSYSRETLTAFSDVLGALYAAPRPEAALQAALPKLIELFRSRCAGGGTVAHALPEAAAAPAQPGLLPAAARDRLHFGFCPPHAAAGVTLHRTHPYSDDEAHLACILQEHIGFVFESDPAVRRGPGSGEAAWELTVTCGEILQGVDPGLAAVLGRYFPGETSEDGKLPRAVGRWLRQQIGAVGESEPGGGRGEALSVAAPGGRLYLQFRPAGMQRGRLRIFEERGAADFFRLRARGLTRRECEVVFWIAQGKRDVEMALILGCAPRTIGKHVENVLVKLGAETRLAAAHGAQEWLRREF